MKKLSNLSYPKPSIMCYLFDMLIKPIMHGLWLRNMELCYITDNNNNLEIIHCNFCKFILVVSTNATNLAVYGKLGCTPLSICRKFKVVKYLHKLCNKYEDLPIYLREHIYLQNQKIKVVYKYYGHFQEFQPKMSISQVMNSK